MNEWIENFKEKHDKASRDKTYSWSQVYALLNYIDERERLIQDLREQRDNLRKEVR